VNRIWNLVGCGFALLALGCASTPADDPALMLHRDAIVIDGHSDTTPWFEDPEWDFTRRHREGHQDLPRMREGGLDAQFWSIYLGKTEEAGAAIRQATARIDAVHRLVLSHGDELALVTTSSGLREAVRSGKTACLLGLEGGHIIEDSLEALGRFHERGVRYMTLTHSFHTNWADSSGTNEAPAPKHGGLTRFGEDVVAEMNRLGMMVDVSHVSDDTFWDVLRVTHVPVIASHSSTRAIADHPRNLDDEMLRGLAKNGGVAMINFYPGYIDASLVAPMRELFLELAPRVAEIRAEHAGDPVRGRRAIRKLITSVDVPTTDLSVLLDHFDHAIRVAGPDHVGLGADWDGVASMPRELQDVSRLPVLTRGLLARGHSPETVRKVLGENLLRVMREVEAAATRAAKE
jgi:membrane dipeptidase